VQRAAERIIARLSEPVSLADEAINIGCSVGGALWSGGKFSEALMLADEALYRAKGAGKGRASFNLVNSDDLQQHHPETV
jgi:GGDEF domain-containing protein